MAENIPTSCKCCGSQPAIPGTIGHLEERAGIAPDHESRFRFWVQFAKLKDGALAAGIARLTEMATAGAGA